eukprot:7519318-Alexandrium_andersonii.AAC.1
MSSARALAARSASAVFRGGGSAQAELPEAAAGARAPRPAAGAVPAAPADPRRGGASARIGAATSRNMGCNGPRPSKR